jgi:glucans biosynthesis protein C
MRQLAIRLSATRKNQLQRRYDIDWLRILAVLLLIFFHAAMIFGAFGWYVQNNVFNSGLTFFVYFVHQWHMPLFFLLSGAGTYFFLNFKTWQQYLVERSQRLLIPLLFGIVAIVPPQVYYSHLFKKKISPNLIFSFIQIFSKKIFLNSDISGFLSI